MKKISVLGDSISTFEGCNPDDYSVFYAGICCARSGVYRKEDTWWWKVIDYFGGELLVNNSWSGSRVSKHPGKKDLFPSGCSDERTGGLHKGGVTPDVIIVYMGMNDWGYGVKIYRNRFRKWFPDKDPETFSGAYSLLLYKLHKNYPSAEIWCCTLNMTCMSSEPSFRFPRMIHGIDIDEYNAVIRRLAESKRYCVLIDVNKQGIFYDTIDGTHPNHNGMCTIAEMVCNEIIHKVR